MKRCKERRETLILDIHGELEPDARSNWEAHLNGCPSCRKERLDMLRLMGKVKNAMEVPLLSEEQVDTSVRALRRRMGSEAEKKWWQRVRDMRDRAPFRFVTAAAAFCCVVLAVALVNRQSLMDSIGMQTASRQEMTKRVKPEDMEVIKNLDLLKEMEAVQKLVQIVDDSNEERQQEKRDSNKQGMIRYEKKEISA